VVLVLLVGISVAIAFVPTPYYLFEPGSVRPTETRIDVVGHQAFHTRGSVLFTTIGIQQATVAGLIRGWLDDAIEVEKRQEVYPHGEKEDRVENQAAMDSSKMTAILVAFHKVGYDVTPTGTGGFISDVLPGFPASKVLRQGDVIEAIDGRAVHLASDVTPALGSKPIGASVELVLRPPGGGRKRTVTVQLGRNPDDPSRGYLGITVETADSDLDLPFDVDIDSGQVTGPSAGLAWTLGLIDRLTPGSLTGGRQVAVTGTIAPDGTVGPIGGVAQKMATVKRAGVKVFLFPKQTDPKEAREVRKIAGSDVEVHQVGTLDEALAIIAPHGVPPAPPLS
jgi:PDZ domain-containing protein